jgi:hypothetical protein
VKQIFWVKILKFFYADTGSEIEKIGFRDGKNSDPGWKNSDPGSEVEINSDPTWKKFGSGTEKI